MAKNDKPADELKPDVKPVARKVTFPSQVMYLGPTMVEDGNAIVYGQIFNNGLPEHYIQKALLEPEFSQLLVAADKVPAAMHELRRSGSRLATISDKLKTEYEKRRSQPKEAK